MMWNRMMLRFGLARVFVLLAVAVCFSTSSIAEELPSNSMLTNGDMSQGEAMPSGWSIIGGKKETVKIQRDTATFHGGPASLLVETTESGRTGVQQRLPNSPAGTLQVSAWVKAEGQFNEVFLFCQMFDNKWKQLKYVVVARVTVGDWTKYEGKVTVPEGVTNLLTGLVVAGKGKVWLDDAAAWYDAPSASPSSSSSPAPAAPAATASVSASEYEKAAPADGVAVAPSEAKVSYVGRFDRSSAQPVFSWPASEIRFSVKDTPDVYAKLMTDGPCRIQMVVDGKEAGIIEIRKKNEMLTYQVAKGLSAGEHTISLVKCTETLFGEMRFGGLVLCQGGQLTTCPARKYKLEVIGDSISAGFGNEAPDAQAKFSWLTENAYKTYGAIAARRFNADFHCMAWSGKKMWPDTTISEVYPRTLPRYGGSKWDFANDQPDVIVVNLGTNDFAAKNPDEEPWVKAYLEFLDNQRKLHPNSILVCALGSMLTDPHSPSKNALTTCRSYLKRVVKEANERGDKKVYFLEFDPQKAENGFGAQYHPSYKTHQLMAEKLVQFLKDIAGWQPV